MGHNPGRDARNVRLSERREFLAQVKCARCRRRRFYPVDDLIRVHGDRRVIGMEGYLRCEDCGGNECLTARLVLPTARERAEIRVRRLVDIRVTRIPVWRDE